jgi:hypothetical protein
MSILAPIVLFVYNRPWHTRQTLEALSKNDLAGESILYIYADGARAGASEEELKKIDEVRAIAREKAWCKEVHLIEQPVNKGLADNIVSGVTEVVNRYGKVIVLEDDIVTSSGFLKFMNNALDLYEDSDKVFHISGYMFPVSIELPDTFFYNQASCWGWATWARAWRYYNPSAEELKVSLLNGHDISHFNLNGALDFFYQLQANIEGKLKTWAVKWHASVYLQNGLCLHPKVSLVQNIGMDGSGVHSDVNDSFEIVIGREVKVYTVPLVENQKARKAVESFYRSIRKPKKSLFERMLQKLKIRI